MTYCLPPTASALMALGDESLSTDFLKKIEALAVEMMSGYSGLFESDITPDDQLHVAPRKKLSAIPVKADLRSLLSPTRIVPTSTIAAESARCVVAEMVCFSCPEYCPSSRFLITGCGDGKESLKKACALATTDSMLIVPDMKCQRVEGLKDVYATIAARRPVAFISQQESLWVAKLLIGYDLAKEKYLVLDPMLGTISWVDMPKFSERDFWTMFV